MSTTDYSMIRLDRSRPFQTIHGDRTQGDPHYNVHFFQGNLPFDAQGALVPPDPDRAKPWVSKDSEGKPITCYPLYNEQMTKVLEAKLKRAAAVKAKDEVDDEEEDASEKLVNLADEVNLEAWLRGQAKYEPHLIYAACKQRYHRSFTRLREVVEELVYDLKLVPEAEVSTDILRHLSG
jgi:hypothetical protein